MQGIDKLSAFIKSLGISQNEFALRHRISQPYLNQIINGMRKAGKKTAVYLEEITHGAVTKRDLRPDVWV